MTTTAQMTPVKYPAQARTVRGRRLYLTGWVVEAEDHVTVIDIWNGNQSKVARKDITEIGEAR